MLKVTKNSLLNRSLLTLDGEFPYVREWVTHLLENNGILGFVQVFKKLKAWALQIVAGNSHYDEKWFAKSYFCGYKIPRKYKNLFQLIIVEVLNPDTVVASKRLRKYLSILNLYHTYFGPTQSDFCSQIEVVKQKAVYPSNHKSYCAMVRLACNAIQISLPSQEGKLAPTGQTVALEPGLNGDWGKFCSKILVEKYGERLVHDYDEMVDLLIHRLKGGSYLDYALQADDLSWMGNLIAIGESGLKTRTILVGNPIIQCKLVILKRRLLDILRKIPTDCTFRQDEGVDFLKKQEKMGKTIYSVDLKDCSWNLPSSLQEEILKYCNVSERIRNLIFRTTVYIPTTKELRVVEKGQAMGLGPSFPLFSLLHNLILWSFCLAEKVSPIDTFRVLGDDVIITDKHVYHAYRIFLRDYDVPISPSKTFISKALGEFAGKIIFKSQDITPLRWRYITWDSLPSMYWIYRNILGPQAVNIMLKSSKDRFALRVLFPIPKKFGGVGCFKTLGDHETSGVIAVRKGILERILLRGKEGEASGYDKIPNYKYTITHGDDPLVREASQMLESYDYLRTKWGDFPRFTPNPYRFLKQVGEDLKGIPFREHYDPSKLIWFRFTRGHSSMSWKDLLCKEVANVQVETKDFGQVVEDSETEAIKYWFGSNRQTEI